MGGCKGSGSLSGEGLAVFVAAALAKDMLGLSLSGVFLGDYPMHWYGIIGSRRCLGAG